MSAPRPLLLQRLPVALFGAVMGLAGLGLAWRRAAAAIGAPPAVGETLLLLAALVFAVVLLAYAAKLLRHRTAVAAEFVHPLAGSFFAAIAISALLLAAGLTPHAPDAARALWIVGAAGEYLAAIAAVRGWIVRATPREAANPAWFVPVVGCIVAPIAGAPLGFAGASWILFGTGIVAWLFLMPMVVQRLVFEAVVPAPATPTICILIAPPAVGFTALDILAGGNAGAPAHILFGGAVFFAALALSMAPRIAQAPFGVPWWAMSFPSAALAAAALRYAEIYPSAGIAWLAISLLALATALIAFLAMRSLAALRRGEFF
ncbi:C4-dicarboxylate ABC transporter [Desertibaculum subflavum]|uniref:SLAC1 family transporter n=1 Tax=Desertibaculum subflavum TaxID=2268458 RepID=UPI000E66E3D3